MPPNQVFISYSHQDKRWRDELETQLKPYLRDGSIVGWADRQIAPGSQWFGEIQSALAKSKAAVLLVSPDFLASDFIHEHELGPLLKAAEQGGVKILWVPVYDSAYKRTALKDYQAVLGPAKPLGSMTRAERAQAWVKICEEIEKALEGPTPTGQKAAGPNAALSNLPDRNPFFTGREHLLALVQKALNERGRAALSGLGGVGKTETALEYAHQHLDEYDHIFWVSTASREALLSGYAAIAGLLNLSEAGAQEQALAVAAVQRWFDSHERWLLILDNADDLAMAREFLPPARGGHALLTTQAATAGTLARIVRIEEMENKEGALFLLRRARCIAEDASLEAAAPAHQEQARKIALRLGGLPLALDQAAAYADETGCGLSGYLDLYKKHAQELLRLRGPLDPGHPDPVASTWALSFENIEKANPAAAELLNFCAFLQPDAVPEELFGIGAPELGPVLGAVASDEFALDRAIAEVLKYSLLYRDPNARTLEIHRLVQMVLKQGMGKATQRLWAERAVRTVNCAFPAVEFSTWTLCERLLAQAHACADLIDQWRLEFPETALLLNKAGFYVDERGRYTEAEPLYQRSLTIREKALGTEHPDVATSLNNLAELYHRQGRYADARPLFERARAIFKRVLDPGHPVLARNLQGLAAFYQKQGQYPLSRKLFEEAQAILETALGSEHPDVAWSIHSLAVLCREQAQDGEAERLFKRAVAIREQALGPIHPELARSLQGLAELYRDQGRYADARPLFERALAIWEQALGPDHPHVATCLENYARLLQAIRRPEEAAPLEARAKAIRAERASETPPTAHEAAPPPAA